MRAESNFYRKLPAVAFHSVSLLASVFLFAVSRLEDSRIENVDGAVVPQRRGHGFDRLDGGRQEMRPDQKVRLLDPSGQRQTGHATLPQRQTQVGEHHAEIHGETVGQVVPAALAMQPDTRRVLLLFGAIRQIDFAVVGTREALADLEELGVAGIGEHIVVRRVLRRVFRRLSPRVLRGRSRLTIPVDVSLQRRQTIDLHATYRELLTCVNGINCLSVDTYFV